MDELDRAKLDGLVAVRTKFRGSDLAAYAQGRIDEYCAQNAIDNTDATALALLLDGPLERSLGDHVDKLSDRRAKKTTSDAEPQSVEEWQQAVNVAAGLLMVEAAQGYGLISGGPVVNADRCRDFLERGEQQGVVPSDDPVAQLVHAYTPRRSQR